MKKRNLKVFHIHRFDDSKSNIAIFETLKKSLDKKDDFDPDFNMSAHKADIIKLGISTGFVRGDKRCFEIVDQVLKDQNMYLILFENYLTLSQDNYQDFWRNLKNNTPKLIVLDDNRYERDRTINNNSHSINSLKPFQNITSFLFRPYTGGKFHHKLIIQYMNKKDTIVYTGSFHPSGKAITSNSESIIGIKSNDLAQDYLSSILWHSGLGNKKEVWMSMQSYPNLFLPGTPVSETAKKILIKTEINMKKYYNKFTYLLKRLQDSEILPTLSNNNDIKVFIENLSSQESKDLFNNNVMKAHDLLLNGRELIFISIKDIDRFFIKKVEEIVKDFSLPLPSLPGGDLNEIKDWLRKINDWANDVSKLMKLKTSKGKVEERIKNLKNILMDVRNTCSNFQSAYDYPDVFGELIKLKEAIYNIFAPHEDIEIEKVPTPPVDIQGNKRKLEGRTTEPAEESRKKIKIEIKYSARGLSDFIKFLRTKQYMFTAIGKKIKVNHITISSMARDVNYGYNRVEVWYKLKKGFPKEFEDWSLKK